MAETDVEEFSPELTAQVAPGAHSSDDASPPPLMLPPAAAVADDPTYHKNQGGGYGHGVGEDDKRQVYSINQKYNSNNKSNGSTRQDHDKGGFHWTLLAAAQASFSPHSNALLQQLQLREGEGGGSQSLEQEEEAL